MSKDQHGNASFNSQSLGPYPWLSSTQGGINESRTRPSSSTGPVMSRSPAFQQQSVEGTGPQLPSSHPPHARLGERSASTQCSPPTYPNLSISPAETTTPSQRALTASQPPPQFTFTDNVAPRRPPTERPGERRRNPVATTIGATPSVYDGYAQVPPSCPPRIPVDPVFSHSSAWTVQDPRAIMRSLPLPQAPAAPRAPPPQRLVENVNHFGSGLAVEPSFPSLNNLYPQLPSFHPYGAVLGPPSTPSYPWEGTDQFYIYPNITVERANPQLQAASIPHRFSSQSTAEGLLYNPPRRLALPSVASVDDPAGLSQGSVMAPNVPGTWPPPSHYPSSHPVPNLTLPMDLNPNYHNLQYQRENYMVDSSQSTVVSTSAREDLRPPRPFSALNPNENLASSRHAGATSFFSGASGFRMRDVQVFENSHVTVNAGKPSDKSIDGWKLLLKKTAPNALHNSSARYDAPKCDEDTRVEVISELMEWIKDRDHPQRVICMTGAAGAGKSALQQSIAECCANDNILGAAYFISSTDPSRNTASTIIPTIAYQLGSNHPILQHSVAAAVERDPLIFSRSLETQMDALVVRPFESLQRSEQCDLSMFPYAILIDGFDECQGEPSTIVGLEHANTKCKAEDRQAELLDAIKNSLLSSNLPFRIFIASRPEWAIRTALGTGGSLHNLAYHIQLSDKYDATKDMRRYLRRRFQGIGLRIGQPNWFTEGDIEALVRAASGQFVYVATVFKYVSERRASPERRLKTVLNWTPEEATRPFEALDMLYTNILLSAKEAYEAVDTHSGRDFLLLFRMFSLDSTTILKPGHLFGPSFLSALLHLESNALEILIMDLRSLVRFTEKEDPPYLIVYHKSLDDFMDQPSRARELFIPKARVSAHFAKCCMQHIIESPELQSLPDRWNDLSTPEKCLPHAIHELDFLLPLVDDDKIFDFTRKGGWHKIDVVLSIPSAFGIIFGGWGDPIKWVNDLDDAAEDLKKRGPEAAAVMSKYIEKWRHFFEEKILKREEGVDSEADSTSRGSDDESSDSD